MKVAFTSTGSSPASSVDPRFGRAKMFLVRDLETATWTTLENDQDDPASHGAGIQAAQRIVDFGVSAVVTGDCGPKAAQVLEAAGVRIVKIASGTVAEALAAFTDGMDESRS